MVIVDSEDRKILDSVSVALKKIRTSKKLSTQELGRRVGKTKRTIEKLERHIGDHSALGVFLPLFRHLGDTPQKKFIMVFNFKNNEVEFKVPMTQQELEEEINGERDSDVKAEEMINGFKLQMVEMFKSLNTTSEEFSQAMGITKQELDLFIESSNRYLRMDLFISFFYAFSKLSNYKNIDINMDFNKSSVRVEIS